MEDSLIKQGEACKHRIKDMNVIIGYKSQVMNGKIVKCILR